MPVPVKYDDIVILLIVLIYAWILFVTPQESCYYTATQSATIYSISMRFCMICFAKRYEGYQRDLLSISIYRWMNNIISELLDIYGRYSNDSKG